MADTKGSATSFAATASQPLVSVITRTHNRHLLLRRAIESILGQTYTNWQHVIVNDGADAAALDEFLKPFAARYNGRLIVVHNPKSLGMQAATNAGLAKATGTYVAIHDDDDSWHEEYLAATVAFLEEKGPESIYQGVISHTVRVLEDIDAQGQVVEVERKPYQPFNEVNLFRVGYENPFPPIAFLYRRSVHGVIGLFDQRYDFVGDMDFNIRFLLRWEIGVVPRPLAYYHWRRKGGADYNNTVTTKTNLHELRFNELMNESLRKAAGNDGAGFGVALNVGRQAVMSVERLGDIKTHLNSITDSISGDTLPRMSDLKTHLSSVSGMLETVTSRQLVGEGHSADIQAHLDRISEILDGLSAGQNDNAARESDFKAHLGSVSSMISDDALPRIADLKAHLGSVSAIIADLSAKQTETAVRESDFKAHLGNVSSMISDDALPRIVDLKAHLGSVSAILADLSSQQTETAAHELDFKAHLGSVSSMISDDALPRIVDLKTHLGSVSAILSGMIAELRDVRAVEETLRSSDAAIDARVQRVELTCEALHRSVSTLNDTLAEMRAESAKWREESLLREKEREQGFHIGPFRMRWRRWSKSKS